MMVLFQTIFYLIITFGIMMLFVKFAEILGYLDIPNVIYTKYIKDSKENTEDVLKKKSKIVIYLKDLKLNKEEQENVFKKIKEGDFNDIKDKIYKIVVK